MRKGGASAKGSEFERKICAQLSYWASDGERSDLFSRNIMSGGRFTIRVKAGDNEHGMPGDIRANHPLAYLFLDHFLVECKHYKDLDFSAWLFDYRQRSLLAGFLKKARAEAQHAGRHMILIGKQNNRDTFIMLDAPVAQAALRIPLRGVQHPFHHVFGVGTEYPVYMFNLDQFTQTYWLKQWIRCLPVAKE